MSIKVYQRAHTISESSDILSYEDYPRQRSIKPHVVAAKLENMKSGTFTEGSMIHFGRIRGQERRYLVDGQHRLTAQIQYGKALLFTVCEWEVEDEDCLNRLYTMFDNCAPRSLTDMCIARGFAQEFGLEPQHLKSIGGAIPFIVGEFGMAQTRRLAKSMTKEAKSEAMRPFLPAARIYLDCLSAGMPNIRKAMMSPPVVAVALYTLANAPEKAKAFWTAAARDEGMYHEDPPKAANVLACNGTTRTVAARVGLCQAVAAAWNAHVQGVKAARFAPIRKPRDVIPLLDTPLEGSKVLRRPAQSRSLRSPIDQATASPA
ncbi:hypothetical protein [Roseomonas genomospecies 6]|uniref:ParB/Sulfiredoxin domain-containing protein n=1 Tax=Roseomonas genomospecies 6 TaxID=214106 RepID=A0A9W7TY03_9PROT|nr:hypothetical protein [Roseomonas genomospecies 6]KAA0680344.1 hypothetical protein DS843_13605 [Roseomonas genomospecies 6]